MKKLALLCSTIAFTGCTYVVSDPPPVMRTQSTYTANATQSTARVYSAEEQRLLNQNPQLYTIQVAAAYNKGSVDWLARTYYLPNTFGFTSSYRGQPWHVLLYGTYPSRAQAATVRATLAPQLQQNGPWLRQMHDVQAQIVSGSVERTGGTTYASTGGYHPVSASPSQTNFTRATPKRTVYQAQTASGAYRPANTNNVSTRSQLQDTLDMAQQLYDTYAYVKHGETAASRTNYKRTQRYFKAFDSLLE